VVKLAPASAFETPCASNLGAVAFGGGQVYGVGRAGAPAMEIRGQPIQLNRTSLDARTHICAFFDNHDQSGRQSRSQQSFRPA
jgi:hypothetical protein